MCSWFVGRLQLAAVAVWLTVAGALLVPSLPAQAADDPLAILIVPDDWRGPLVRDRARRGDPWSNREVDAREDLTDPWSGWPAVHYGQCNSDCSVVLIPTGWGD